MAEADVAPASPGGQSKSLLILVILLGLLALAGAGGVAYLMLAADAGGDEPAVAAQTAEPLAEQVYLALEPAFVVNFQGRSDVRFLQINLKVGARDEAVLQAVQAHEPVIRNDLVLLYSSQDPAVLATLEGKAALRQQTLDTIRRILKAQVGRDDVEDVYFTGFVMQ